MDIEMKDGAEKSTKRLRQYRCVGGTKDGQWVRSELIPQISFPITPPSQITPLGEVVDLTTAYKTECYFLEAFRGEHEIFYFYRWSELSVDQALCVLFRGEH